MAKILVVDDEIELKRVLVEGLSARSHQARGYTSAHEALAVLRAERFDLLISDLMMPEMSGLALIKAALEIDPHLAIIVMTGQGTRQSAEEAGLGGAEYLLKPFTMRTLQTLITRALKSRKPAQKEASFALQVGR